RFSSFKAPPEHLDGLAGLVIDGRFCILEKLGAGGTAEVYAAHDKDSGKTVAFKIAIGDGKRDLEKMNQFIENEISRLKSLSHERIIRCIGGGDFRGRKYAVLELLEGQSLERKMQSEGGLQWEASRNVLVKVCDALSEVHNKGMVHRDLKPANIFLTSDGD